MADTPASGGIGRLVEQASFIFVGKVDSRGRSSVRDLRPRPELVVARLERALRVDPVLGDLTGQPITVFTHEAAGFKIGERRIFFANSWVHAEAIAVVAVETAAADEVLEVAVIDTVEGLPRRHLAERVAKARLVVHGTVDSVAPAPPVPGPLSEHSPRWMEAHLRVVDILKGEAPKGRTAASRALVAYFPGSDDVAFRQTPRLHEGDEAVYLLHAPPSGLPENVLVLPDPADVQHPTRKAEVRELVPAGDQID